MNNKQTRPTVDEMFAAYERQQEAVEELAARIETVEGCVCVVIHGVVGVW